MPKGLARAVQIELFKDILLTSPFFFGMNISTDVFAASEHDNTSVRAIASIHDLALSMAMKRHARFCPNPPLNRSQTWMPLWSQVAGDICLRLSTLYKTQGLNLTQAREVPDALYIVRTGVVGLQLHGREIGLARPGGVVGEMALLGLSPDGCRIRTSVCHTMCELCVISRYPHQRQSPDSHLHNARVFFPPVSDKGKHIPQRSLGRAA